MALVGPHIVVAINKGVIVAGWFHLTRGAAERRADKVRGSHDGCNMRVAVYDLAAMITAFELSRERSVEELERMMKL